MAVAWVATVRAEIPNGSFESGYLTYWKTVYGSNAMVYNPGGNLGPIQGSYIASVSSRSNEPYFPSDSTIEYSLGWQTGHLDQISGRQVIEGGVIYRIFRVYPGDRLKFKWDFVRQTGLPGGNDFAFFAVNDQVVILGDNSSSFEPVDSWSVHTTFKQYVHTFTQSAVVKVAFGVVDVDDITSPSALLIDDVDLISDSGGTVMDGNFSIPSQVPDPFTGADSDGDGISDFFESSLGLDRGGKDIYRRIEVSAANWQTKVEASNSYDESFTIYKLEYAVPGAVFSDVHAGDELILHLVFKDPLVVSSRVPELLYIGASSFLPGSILGAAGTSLDVSMVGNLVMRPSTVTVGVQGVTPALYALGTQNETLTQGKIVYQAFLIVKVGPGWSTANLPVGKILVETMRPEYMPDATYADFPVRAVPLSIETPALNLQIGSAVFISFDAAAGFNYTIQSSDTPNFKDTVVVETVPGNNERFEKYFSLISDKQYFRVIPKSVFE